MQRQELALQREELKLQREEQRASRAELKAQAEHLANAAAAQNRLAESQERLATAQESANEIAREQILVDAALANQAAQSGLVDFWAQNCRGAHEASAMVGAFAKVEGLPEGTPKSHLQNRVFERLG